MLLKKAIVSYLQSKKLKKRNSSFIDIYKRINEELKSRKGIKGDPKKNSNCEESENASEAVTNTILASTNPSSKTGSFFGEFEAMSEEKESYFLKRKFSSASVLEVEIPSFLHDKKNASRECEKTKKEDSQKKEEVNGKLFEVFKSFRIR